MAYLQQVVDFDREQLKETKIQVRNYDGGIHFEKVDQPSTIHFEKVDQPSTIHFEKVDQPSTVALQEECFQQQSPQQHRHQQQQQQTVAELLQSREDALSLLEAAPADALNGNSESKQQQQLHQSPPVPYMQKNTQCDFSKATKVFAELKINPNRKRSMKRANTNNNDEADKCNESEAKTEPTSTETTTTTTTTTAVVTSSMAATTTAKTTTGLLKSRCPMMTPRSWYVYDMEPDLEVVKILPGLTMGSQDAAASLDHLLAFGVTHVINLASFVDNFFKEKLVYKTISARDIPEFKISVHFEEANDFIDEAIKADGVVFVHCNAGISRAGSVVTAYVMKTLRMGFEAALAFVKSKRSVVRPNAGFVEQLKEYEKTLDLDAS